MGIRLEDIPDGDTIWKLEDREKLIAEREEKKRIAEEKEQAKAKLLAERQQKEHEKEMKARIDPAEMFLGMTDQYSKFDEKVGEGGLYE